VHNARLGIDVLHPQSGRLSTVKTRRVQQYDRKTTGGMYEGAIAAARRTTSSEVEQLLHLVGVDRRR